MSFSFFLPLPEGVILLMEESLPSSAGPHSASFQGGRVGPKFPAPVWIRGRPSFRPPCVLDLSQSFPRSKCATPKRGTWTAVTGTKKGLRSGAPRRPERQRRRFDALRPLTLMESCLPLHPTGLTLPLNLPQTRSWEKASAQHPARLKPRPSSPRRVAGEKEASPARCLTPTTPVVSARWRTRLYRNQFSFHLKFCHRAARPEVCKGRPRDSAKVRRAS